MEKSEMNWSFLIIAYMSMACVGLGFGARNAIFLEILGTFQINNQLGSYFLSIPAVIGIPGMYLANWLTPRLGLVRSCQLFLLMLTASFYVQGVSTQYAQLLGGATLFGLSLGGLFTLQNNLVLAGVPSKFQRQALSGLVTIMGLLVFAGPIIVTSLQNIGVTWQEMHANIFPVLPAFVFVAAFFGRESNPANAYKVAPKDASLFSMANRAGLLFVIMSGLVFAAEMVIAARLAQFGRDVMFLSTPQANWFLSMFLSFLIGSRIIFTFVRVPMEDYSVLTYFPLLSIFFCAMGVFAHPYFWLLGGFFLGPLHACMATVVSKEYGVKAFRILGTRATSNAIAVFTAQWIVGFLADHFGLPIAMYISVLCILLAYALLALKESRYPSPTQEG